jgi:hypothetical protein
VLQNCSRSNSFAAWNGSRLLPASLGIIALPDQIMWNMSQLNCLKQVDRKHSSGSSNSLHPVLLYSLQRCTFYIYIFAFTFVCRSGAEARLVEG